MRFGPIEKILAGTALSFAMLASSAGAEEPDPKVQIPAQRKEATMRGDFTLGAVGDLIYGTPVTRLGYRGFDDLTTLLKSPDVTIANAEVPIFDLSGYKGQRTVYTRLQGPASLAPDIAAMGIDMVTTANNHAMDWGVDGLMQMTAALDGAGLRHAGTGPTLGFARAPAYYETAKGRISLVDAASTFSEDAPAADQVGEAPARAGISMLRTTRVAFVTPQEMAALRDIATRHAVYRTRPPAADAKELNLFGQDYRVSDKRGFAYAMNRYDQFEVLRNVRAAKSLSDMTVFAIHAHESATGSDDDNPEPADFLPELFHDVIDAGADVVLGQGSHALRGIEIYKGKPIFYGIGLFMLHAHFIVSPEGYQARGLDPHRDVEGDFRSSHYGKEPADWNDGVMGMIDFQNGRPRRVRLYPLELGSLPDKTDGIPQLAAPVRGREILQKLQARSLRFGTKIVIEKGVGTIDLR